MDVNHETNSSTGPQECGSLRSGLASSVTTRKKSLFLLPHPIEFGPGKPQDRRSDHNYGSAQNVNSLEFKMLSSHGKGMARENDNVA
jgi:hypothetical protein